MLELDKADDMHSSPLLNPCNHIERIMVLGLLDVAVEGYCEWQQYRQDTVHRDQPSVA